MAADSRAVFNATAGVYESQRRRLIPCYDAFYGAILNSLPFTEEDSPLILELGAGTGLLSTMLRTRFPKAKLVLIDSAEDMLIQARARFAHDTNVEYHHADFAAYRHPDPVDAVASSLAIHHLSHEGKQALFKTIKAGLKDGGTFVNGDQVDGEGYRTQWQAACRAIGATDTDLADAASRMQADILAPLDDQLTWMQEAGFAEANCTFQDGWFTVMRGA